MSLFTLVKVKVLPTHLADAAGDTKQDPGQPELLAHPVDFDGPIGVQPQEPHGVQPDDGVQGQVTCIGQLSRHGRNILKRERCRGLEQRHIQGGLEVFKGFPDAEELSAGSQSGFERGPALGFRWGFEGGEEDVGVEPGEILYGPVGLGSSER